MRSSRYSVSFALCFWTLFSVQSSSATCLSITIPTPNASDSDVLIGTSGTSRSDIWGVGAADGNFPDPYQHILIEHFNGFAWSIVPSPSGKRHTGSVLTSVTASSPTDAWAVGLYNNANEYPRPLAVHWDGTAWKQVETHSFGPCYVWRQFTGISVNPTNAHDVWAVGWAQFECNAPAEIGFAEHWDGNSWDMIKLRSTDLTLNAVSTTSQGAWAVGSMYVRGSMHPYTVLLRGSSATEWPASHKYGALTSVSALAPNDVWAVGYNTRRTGAKPIIEHFNGTAWSSVSNPYLSGDAALKSVSTLSPTDVWSVGTQGTAKATTRYRTLVEHWNGSSWSLVPSASVGVFSALSGVFAVGDRAVAVGAFTLDGQKAQILGSLATCATDSPH